jgi:hypothetical protein
VLLAAPLTTHLVIEEPALHDLRTALVMLAVHEGFSGFIMTGDAADFVAAVMSPYRVGLRQVESLVSRRNAFVAHMAGEMSYWAGWPALTPEGLSPAGAGDDPEMHQLLALLAGLRSAVGRTRPTRCGTSAPTPGPRTLASLSRYEIRKRGLDVTESTRRIMISGLMVAATDLHGWLAGWTRRDLLGFLAQSGLRPRTAGVRSGWRSSR